MPDIKPWEEYWHVVKPLGKGGQGSTMLVAAILCTSQHNQAVLKILKDQPTEEQTRHARSRMLVEVGNLRAVASTGARVPSVYDDNTTEHLDDLAIPLYFVMTHIEGETLAAHMEKGPLTLDLALAITESLLDTITRGHRVGIMHRDIKPANIILAQGGSAAYMIDYGLSFNEAGANDLTRPAEQFGSSFLRLPELLAPGDNNRDPRSDLTLLSGVLFYCLSNEIPGTLQDGSAVAPHRRSSCKLPNLYADSPILDALNPFFDRAFQPDVRERIQTHEDLARRLKHLRESQSEPQDDDPFEIAHLASLSLRQNDRATKVAAYKKNVKTFADWFAYYCNENEAKLANTEFKLYNTGNPFDSPLPPEFRHCEKLHAGTTLALKPMAHELERWASFGLLHDGSEGIIVRADHWKLPGILNAEFSQEWREVGRCSVSVPLEQSFINRIVYRWLRDALADLKARLNC